MTAVVRSRENNLDTFSTRFSLRDFYVHVLRALHILYQIARQSQNYHLPTYDLLSEQEVNNSRFRH